MRRMALFLLVALLLPGPRAAAEFAADTDYMERMIEAAVSGDRTAGLEAQASREEKIAALGLDYGSVDFDELLLLAKIIQAEAGSVWLDEDWKMAVGEVVLNRVASPEFPDSVAEVIYQPGQYYGRGSRYFNSLLPSAESARAAARLLSGERVLFESAVVFQSNYILGGGVYLELKDAQLGSTYLCYSSHRELYEG